MRRVLITGGSRGIGAACVRAFAESGDEVFFLYKNSEEAARRLSEETGATAMKCDVADSEALSVAIHAVGQVDVLVANAGVSLIRLFTDTDDAALGRVLDTDLKGAMVAAREASRPMIRVKKGKIILIGSVWGRVGASMEVAYSAAKAGIEGLTKGLAKELGPSGITVNCVEPGVIRTEMNAELGEETLSELADETPLCRIGEPEDVAKAVLWLASGETDFITGQILGVDGGFGL